MGLPSDWKLDSIGNLFETATGSTPPKSQKDNYGNDVPFVKPPELLDSDIFTTADNLSEKGAASSRTLPSGSVLISCIGNLGKVGMNSQTVAFNQQINAIRPSDNFVSKFMFYQALSPWFKAQLEELASGTTVHIVNKSKFNSIKVMLPPIPEQKRIVAILDQAFAEIEQVRAKTEHNLKNARELFESYLQQVFSQRGEGWLESTLEETCEFSNGKAHEKAIDENGEFIVINSKFISTQGTVAKHTKQQRHPLFKGDIAMVMSDVPGGKTFAKCFIVPKDNLYSLNQRICSIKSEYFNTRFLYFQLNRNSYLLAFDNKGSQANLRKSEILSCPLFVPPIDEQKSIGEKLNTASNNTKKLELIYMRKLKVLNEMKKSILQKAFTGELTKNDSNGAAT